MNPAKIEWHEWNGRTHEGLKPLYPNGQYIVKLPHNNVVVVYAENDTTVGLFAQDYGVVTFCDWMGHDINQDEILRIALLKED